MSWKKLLESVSASLNDYLRLRNDYLMAENHILRHQMNGRVQLTDNERQELAELGAKLGKQALQEIATIAKPETILAWHRKFADQQAVTSQPPKRVGRPRVDHQIEAVVIRMARENRSWGYDRIQGALKNLGYRISNQTVGNILKRHGISPAPARKTTVTWREFLRCHLDVLLATDFLQSEVWRWCGLVLASLLRFIRFGHHHVCGVGMTLRHQRRWTRSRLLRFLHCRVDGEGGVHEVKKAALARVMLFRGGIRRQSVTELTMNDYRASSLQSRAKVVPISAVRLRRKRDDPMRCRQRLSGLQKDDQREAA